MGHHIEQEHRTMGHHIELEHRTLDHDLSSSSHCLDQEQPVVVEICLKREPESPCPDLNPLPGGEPGLGVDQGDLGQTYPEYAALNLGYGGYTDTSGLFFTYSSENQLQQHTSSSTTTTDDYASFPGKQSVTVIPGHHGDQRGNGGTVRIRAPLSKEKEGRFVCKHCGKGFPYISCLKRHALNHTRERTHHCSMCGRSFIRPSHLRRHELLHTGVRPFACALCGRHFSHGAHLRAHMKTHTWWKCPVCVCDVIDFLFYIWSKVLCGKTWTSFKRGDSTSIQQFNTYSRHLFCGLAFIVACCVARQFLSKMLMVERAAFIGQVTF